MPNTNTHFSDIIKQGESILRLLDQRVIYRTGRELMTLLGYRRWSTFLKVIHKAAKACQWVGEEKEAHFQVISSVMAGVRARAFQREYDYVLDRYACYLIVHSAYPAKPEIVAIKMVIALQAQRRKSADASLLSALRQQDSASLLLDPVPSKKEMQSANVLSFDLFNAVGYSGFLDRMRK